MKFERGVFLDSATINWNDLDLSGLASTLSHWDFFPKTSLSELISRLEKAEIVITNKVPLTQETIENAKNLRCICVAATGYDNVDLNAANKKQIVVCNASNYSTLSVVQHTIGLMISLASQTIAYSERVKSGDWSKSEFFCLNNYLTHSLENKVLGIIGYGAIGKGVAQVATALGMKILKHIPLPELLPQVDFLSLHCPLTPQTKGMINEETISMMKPQACIINTARGALIDEKALANALISGRLAGAGVDVLSQEPPPSNHVLLQNIPNLIITPHVAWSTQEARQQLLNQLQENVRAFLAGSPIRVVH